MASDSTSNPSILTQWIYTTFLPTHNQPYFLHPTTFLPPPSTDIISPMCTLHTTTWENNTHLLLSLHQKCTQWHQTPMPIHIQKYKKKKLERTNSYTGYHHHRRHSHRWHPWPEHDFAPFDNWPPCPWLFWTNPTTLPLWHPTGQPAHSHSHKLILKPPQCTPKLCTSQAQKEPSPWPITIRKLHNHANSTVIHILPQTPLSPCSNNLDSSHKSIQTPYPLRYA